MKGAITSTANDMARWMLMLLSGGENEAGEQVFSRDVIEQLRQPVNAHTAVFNAVSSVRPPLYVVLQLQISFVD